MTIIRTSTGKRNYTINTNDVWERIIALESLHTESNIKGTKQSVIFNSDGTVQKVQHKNSNDNLLREDVFTYEDTLITEIRTLSNGSVLTFKYHLDTLETEVI